MISCSHLELSPIDRFDHSSARLFSKMNLPAVTPLRDGVSKGRISILIPLTPASSAGQALTLSRDGERESKGTLQRATGNYRVKSDCLLAQFISKLDKIVD
jgi:hypothetical protein